MDDRKRIAAIIRDYIARERMSREQFAFKTKLGKSTVDKLLIGLFSDRTLLSSKAKPGCSSEDRGPLSRRPTSLPLLDSARPMPPQLRFSRSQIWAAIPSRSSNSLTG